MLRYSAIGTKDDIRTTSPTSRNSLLLMNS